MDVKGAVGRLAAGRDLGRDEMAAVMRDVMGGGATDAQNAAFLTALQIKGATAPELLGAATVMRELAAAVPVAPGPHLVDTCGTGGSGLDTFNISTAAALAAAAAGVRVAKHGNRAATGSSGSADVLEAAGVSLALGPEQVARCIEEAGMGFMFAPAHHGAMRHVAAVRREIGVRTVFNLLGPLTNPAGASSQVIGVFDADRIPTMLEALRGLGGRHVLAVAAEDGLDEISTAAATAVGELKDGEIRRYKIAPEDFGVERLPDLGVLKAEGPERSLAMVRDALSGRGGPAADIVALNAGAAVYVAGLAGTLAEGAARAREAMAAGRALTTLERLVRLSRELAGADG